MMPNRAARAPNIVSQTGKLMLSVPARKATFA